MASKKEEEGEPSYRVSVEWKPYMIDPGTEINGEEFEAYNRRRWGGSGWTMQLKEQGSRDGATFQNWKWWPNTLKAHQLVQYASTQGVDSATSNSALFEALYEEGQNVSLVDTLVEIGQNKLGLDRDEVKEYLEQDSGAATVQREIQRCKQSYQVSGVPFFVIRKGGNSQDPPYGLSGAQSSSKFTRIFEELSE